jgi:hypothetical protein
MKKRWSAALSLTDIGASLASLAAVRKPRISLRNSCRTWCAALQACAAALQPVDEK